MLQENEFSEEVNHNSVKSFDTNQLPSNNPVEDARAEGRALYTTGEPCPYNVQRNMFVNANILILFQGCYLVSLMATEDHHVL